MSVLTTKKIISKLNRYFAQGNQYVFWYDDKQQFTDYIDQIATQLPNVKLYKAQANQQFKAKVELLADSKQKYLIYAPYERPKIQKNFLTDMELYSRIFTADASQIILEELHLPQDKLQFVKQYHAFFGAKTRRTVFVKYWSNDFNKEPEKGILAAITKTEKLDMNELLMKVVAAGTENNRFFFAFTKYGVLNNFWQLIGKYFGYETEEKADLKDLLSRLFVTYLANELNVKLPHYLQDLVVKNKDNVQIFIDRFADSNKFRKYYGEISTFVWQRLKLRGLLENEIPAVLTKVTIFVEINNLVLAKLRAKFDGPEITDREQVLEIIDQMLDRTRNNFSPEKEAEYKFLRYAAELLNLHVPMVESWQDELKNYLENDYRLDTIYRKSLLAYTNIKNADDYIPIKRNLDLYYSNVLLNDSVQQWNQTFNLAKVPNDLRQECFYHNYVAHVRERIVVILSDAFRYEVAKELAEELDTNDRLTLTMHYALTGLPSVTYIGMNVMLPHKKLSWDNKNSRVKVNGQNADNAASRQQILKSYDQNNAVMQLKDLLTRTSKEVKRFIAGKNVIYLYHNQIDAKGHELKTTQELVSATEKAIQEIKAAIQVLRTNGVAHIIVTADHGFIYQEREIQDTDKIDLSDQNYQGNAHLRYLITPSRIKVKGVKGTTMGISLNNANQTNVYYPTSPNEFVAKSGNKNYVHGGSSIQEMLIPVLDIKATSRKSAAKPAEIKLAATRFRINNLKMNLLFNQVEPISDTVLPAEYHVFFTDQDGKFISNSVTILANRTGSAADRTIAVTITIQDKHYDLKKNYYLVIQQVGKNSEYKRVKYQMDLLTFD